MGLIQIYIIFAITTAITCCIIFFLPELKSAKKSNINNGFVNSPILSIFAYTLIAAVVAPILFLILLNNKASVSYRLGIKRIINEEK
jgi:hypothetical protein